MWPRLEEATYQLHPQLDNIRGIERQEEATYRVLP